MSSCWCQAMSTKPTDSSEMIASIRRKAYLSGKGIDAKVPFQLDILFPKSGGSRTIPNDYARSSLFTARDKRSAREVLERETLFHLHDGVSVVFTGIELRAEDDEIVWLQILHYAKAVPLGEPFSFTIGDLVRDIGWVKNGRYYDKARACISRLKASEVLVTNEKAFGASGAISLIDRYTIANDKNGLPTQYSVLIDKNLILLFAGNTFTNHDWPVYRRLSPIARRLADYIGSHKNPFPLDLEKFGLMCGTRNKSESSWAANVRKVCLELEEAGIAKQVRLHEKRIYTVR